MPFDSNYHPNISLSATINFSSGPNGIGTSLISFTLLLIDSAKTSDLVSKLSQKCSWFVDDLEYIFVAEQCMNQIIEGNGQVKNLPGVKISFDVTNASSMLDYIFKQLYEIGYGLDFHEQYNIRFAFNVGSERQYLERANSIIKELIKKGDEPLCIEFKMLQRLCFEIGDPYRDSLVYKIARKLQSHRLYKSAHCLASIYRGNLLLKKLILELESSHCVLNSNDFSEIQRKPQRASISKILAISTNNDFQEKFLFEFIARLYSDREKIVQCLSSDTLCLEASMSLSTFEPQCDVVRCLLPKDKRYELDKVFMSLSRSGFALEVKGQYDIRSKLGLNKLEDYIKFAFYVISLLKSDDVTSFEFNWLELMSYELPVNIRSKFIFTTSFMLRQKQFVECALSLCVLYRDDPLYEPLSKFTDEVQKVVDFRALSSYTKPKDDESEDERNTRLEEGIRCIVKRGCYERFKTSVNKMLCELVKVNEGSQDVISLFNPDNIDLSFRKVDKFRMEHQSKYVGVMQFSGQRTEPHVKDSLDTSTAEQGSSLKHTG